MSTTQLKKIEQMTIEQLKQKAPKELARLSFNAAGMDDKKLNLLMEATPYAVYKMPVYEFRDYFGTLETVSYMAGLNFWRYYTLILLGKISDDEFVGVVMALNDAVEHFELDQKKVAIMGMGAFFNELANSETLQDNHCEKMRQQVFNEIIDGLSF